MTGATATAGFPLRLALRVALAHDYFGGTFDQFTTLPLPNTAVVCRRFGLQLRQEGSTLALYVRGNSLRWKPGSGNRTELGQCSFCWEIIPRPPQFAAVTDVDFAGSEQAIVLHRSSDAPAGDRLTSGKFVSEKDVKDRRPLAFDFVPARPLAVGTKLEIATFAGEVVARTAVVEPGIVPIDVSVRGSGEYELAHGKRVLARWFADERGRVMPSPTPSSMLVLDGELVAAAVAKALNSPSQSTSPTYTAHYPARKITWRYHVFNAAPGEELQIAPLDDALGMSLPSDESGSGRGARASRKPRPDERAAFVPISAPEYPTAASFESVAAFKLVQRPPQRFALLSQGAPRFSPLPVAEPSFASRGQNAGFSSDIFVYL